MAQKRAGSKSRPNRQVTEEALLEDNLAREAFEKLTEQRGVNKDKLMSLLSRIPYASNEAQPLIDGMRNRRVHALPDRIHSWADKIEKANASPWLTPALLPRRASMRLNLEHWPKPLDVTLSPEWAELTAKRFQNLPRTLRLNANHLRAWLKVFHPTDRGRRVLGFRTGLRLQTYLTLELLRLVRDAARRPCYKEIATLLDAACRVTGKARTISEDNLRKLEKNNPWLSWVLRDFSEPD